MRWLPLVLLIAALCGLCYALGRSHTQVKIITEQVEVIKYVEKKTAQIHAKPNAGRDDLLKLMHADKL